MSGFESLFRPLTFFLLASMGLCRNPCLDLLRRKAFASLEKSIATWNPDSSTESTQAWKCTEDNPNDLFALGV